MRRPEGTAQQVGAGEEADGAVQGLGLLDLTVFLGLGDVNIWWLYCICIDHMYIYSIYIYVCVRVFQYILNAYLKKYANAYNTYVYINMCIYIYVYIILISSYIDL